MLLTPRLPQINGEAVNHLHLAISTLGAFVRRTSARASLTVLEIYGFCN
jgi:hypothetical protein